jgi:hypothetical protein
MDDKYESFIQTTPLRQNIPKMYGVDNQTIIDI